MVFALTALGWTLGGPRLQAMGIQRPDTFFALAALVSVVWLGLASWTQLSEQTDWGVLILFGGGLALGDLLGASGASQVLGTQVAQGLEGSNPVWMLLAVCAFMVLLSEFASNTAAAALLIPVFAAIGSRMGLPQDVLVITVALAASCGFALPVATPPNALVFGTGRIPQWDMLRAGGALDLVCIAVVSLWAWSSLP